MKNFKIVLLFIVIAAMTSCASSYQKIAPESINYVSKVETEDVTLEYKYSLLNRKYAKKELKKDIKLVAVKITNNSNTELMFGRDIKLAFDSGNTIEVMDKDQVFSSLKQKPATHLFYLLLTPLTVGSTKTNEYGAQETTSMFPIGVILGPALAGGNLYAASAANKKFKNDLLENNLNGTVIKPGETKFGLVGIKSDSYHSLRLKHMSNPIVQN